MPARDQQQQIGELEVGAMRRGLSACPSRWLTASNGLSWTAAIALPVMSPTMTAPIRPGPAVAATPSRPAKPTLASSIARAMRPSRCSTWLRAAISGTTPP